MKKRDYSRFGTLGLSKWLLAELIRRHPLLQVEGGSVALTPPPGARETAERGRG